VLVGGVQQGGLLVPLVAAPLAPEAVDRPPPRDGHDPAAGVRRRTVDRPPLDGEDEGVLDRLLGQRDVAEDADQGRDR